MGLQFLQGQTRSDRYPPLVECWPGKTDMLDLADYLFYSLPNRPVIIYILLIKGWKIIHLFIRVWTIKWVSNCIYLDKELSHQLTVGPSYTAREWILYFIKSIRNLEYEESMYRKLIT